MMVSFFGLRFGDKKKKPLQTTKKPKQWDEGDRNLSGESQFFGDMPDNSSISHARRVSGPMTAQFNRKLRSYHDDIHGLAVSSMVDLSRAKLPRPSSSSNYTNPSLPNLKHSTSDAILHTNFSNASWSTLPMPSPTPPSPQVRPSTSALNKAWVNPLDVHFMRHQFSMPLQVPMLAQVDFAIPAAQDDEDDSSLFGDKVEIAVNSLMASLAQKEQEENEARQRELEEMRKRETARLEKQRQERQKATESVMIVKPLPGSVARERCGTRPGFLAVVEQVKRGYEGPHSNLLSVPEPTRAPRDSRSLSRLRGAHSGEVPPPMPKGFGVYQAKLRGPELQGSGRGTKETDTPGSGARPIGSSESGSRPRGPPPDSRGHACRIPGSGLQERRPNSQSLKAGLSASEAASVACKREAPKPTQTPMSSMFGSMASSSATSSHVRGAEPLEHNVPRPVVPDVKSKRDTLTSIMDARQRNSLLMKIEQLDKTLEAAQMDMDFARPSSSVRPPSLASSTYSGDGRSPEKEGPPISADAAPVNKLLPQINTSMRLDSVPKAPQSVPVVLAPAMAPILNPLRLQPITASFSRPTPTVWHRKRDPSPPESTNGPTSTEDSHQVKDTPTFDGYQFLRPPPIPDALDWRFHIASLSSASSASTIPVKVPLLSQIDFGHVAGPSSTSTPTPPPQGPLP